MSLRVKAETELDRIAGSNQDAFRGEIETHTKSNACEMFSVNTWISALIFDMHGRLRQDILVILWGKLERVYSGLTFNICMRTGKQLQ